MALKSSQPRRSASVRSERPILRTTNPVATPNTCSLGLAKYVVAMAAVSLARGRRGENGALASRVSTPCENRGRAENSKPTSTKRNFAGRIVHLHPLLHCVTIDWCRLMLAGLRRVGARTRPAKGQGIHR